MASAEVQCYASRGPHGSQCRVQLERFVCEISARVSLAAAVLDADRAGGGNAGGTALNVPGSWATSRLWGGATGFRLDVDALPRAFAAAAATVSATAATTGATAPPVFSKVTFAIAQAIGASVNVVGGIPGVAKITDTRANSVFPIF